jgi:hypothetical protein
MSKVSLIFLDDLSQNFFHDLHKPLINKSRQPVNCGFNIINGHDIKI